MRIYKAVDDLRVPGRWFLGRIYDSKGHELNPNHFTRGVPVRVDPPIEVHLRDVGRPLDFTFADLDAPIVTPAVAEVFLRLAPNETEVIPARVESVEGEFALLNVTRKLRCLDERRSEIMWWGPEDGRPDKVGQYQMISRFVIVASTVQECPMFRIDGWEVALLVQEELKIELERLGVRGLRFRRLETS